MDVITRDIQKSALWTLPYADVVFLAAPSRQKLMDNVRDGKSDNRYGLELNVSKTEYMELGQHTDASLSIDEPLQKATIFRYLGTTLRVKHALRKMSTNELTQLRQSGES